MSASWTKPFKGPIIVIEDDGHFALEQVFDHIGLEHPVIYCTSSEEVREHMEEFEQDGSATARAPCLIFLDMNLPDDRGEALLQMLKNDDKLRSIPVVALTNSAWKAEVERSYDAGVNSYIAKTPDFDTFTAKVRDTLTYWLDFVELPVVK